MHLNVPNHTTAITDADPEINRALPVQWIVASTLLRDGLTYKSLIIE